MRGVVAMEGVAFGASIWRPRSILSFNKQNKLILGRKPDQFSLSCRVRKLFLYADPFDVEAQKKIGSAIRQPLLYADPFDVEAHKKIESAIRQRSKESKGTVIVLMIVENGIVIGMDSRATLYNTNIASDSAVKFVKVGHDVYVSFTGRSSVVERIYSNLASWIKLVKIEEDHDVTVSEAAYHVHQFIVTGGFVPGGLECEEEIFIFGIENKQPRAYRQKNYGDKDLHDIDEWGVCGSRYYATREILGKWNSELSVQVQEVEELIIDGILKTALQDPGVGGSIIVRHVTVDGCTLLSNDLVVELYREKYESLRGLNSTAVFLLSQLSICSYRNDCVAEFLMKLKVSPDSLFSYHIIGGLHGVLAGSYIIRLLLFIDQEDADKFLNVNGRKIHQYNNDRYGSAEFLVCEPSRYVLENLLDKK